MQYIIGIDEVGRGPLAGPVTVCAVMCEENFYKKLKRDKRLPPLGKDSKKLSPESRQKYAKILHHIFSNNNGRLCKIGKYVVIHISNKVIDHIGISYAIKKAIARGLKNLVTKHFFNTQYSKFHILLDGGLKAPPEFTNQKTIIKGDEKEKIIAWASILAKVSRDSLMRRAHKKYSRYGFHIHKGYGTQAHRTAIQTFGLSDFHRKSFCKNFT